MTITRLSKKVAVAGASGHIGSLAVSVMRARKIEVVEISRTAGIDLQSGAGLDDILVGVDTVLDVTNTGAQDPDVVVSFFTAVTENLLSAEERAGVSHHVALSIVGLSDPAPNGHYAGKLAQEASLVAGPIPWTIVRATQFYDFAAMVVGWTESDGAATIAPLLLQPIAPADVASALVDVALASPQGRHIEIAGPETQDLVDMARRTLAVREHVVRLVPTWNGPFGVALAGDVLLPGPDARIMPTTFEDWLAAGAV
jgi:uncharacterized protein YbjT (DUF2867 family)